VNGHLSRLDLVYLVAIENNFLKYLKIFLNNNIKNIRRVYKIFS
jgi:hypothetical protein